jgi:hypothetical protein
MLEVPALQKSGFTLLPYINFVKHVQPIGRVKESGHLGLGCRGMPYLVFPCSKSIELCPPVVFSKESQVLCPVQV